MGNCPGGRVSPLRCDRKISLHSVFCSKRPEPGRADLVRTSVKTTLGSNKKRADWVAFSWGCGEELPKYQLSLGQDLSWAGTSLFTS